MFNLVNQEFSTNLSQKSIWGVMWTQEQWRQHLCQEIYIKYTTIVDPLQLTTSTREGVRLYSESEQAWFKPCIHCIALHEWKGDHLPGQSIFLQLGYGHGSRQKAYKLCCIFLTKSKFEEVIEETCWDIKGPIWNWTMLDRHSSRDICTLLYFLKPKPDYQGLYQLSSIDGNLTSEKYLCCLVDVAFGLLHISILLIIPEIYVMHFCTYLPYRQYTYIMNCAIWNSYKVPNNSISTLSSKYWLWIWC